MFSNMDSEVILAIDACSATSCVKISKSGRVTGLIEDDNLNSAKYAKIRDSIAAFQKSRDLRFMFNQKDYQIAVVLCLELWRDV